MESFLSINRLRSFMHMKKEFIPTGFDKLDQKIGGFHLGELIVVAGRPLMGKTAFVLTMAQRMSNDHHINIVYFSLEMDREQVLERVKQINNVQKDINENKNNLWVDDTPGISVAQLKQKCIECQKEQNIDIVFIDYLQLMSGDDKCESRIQELDCVANGLKELATKLNVPMGLVVQQGRSVEQTRDFRPILSDLRESGSIAQIADTIIMLYRDEYYNHNSEKKGVMEIYIEKQKHGEIGIVELGWSSDGPRVV